MTATASSLPFTTMEVPALDDSMEMASPYQGQVDDFDIDLDVMEDQTSNPDKDMTLADDNMEYNNYGANDTDMTDDVAERAMVDADDQHPDNVDLQYGDEIYEAEMVEENYDEDIDAPVPNNEAQDIPVTLDHTSNHGLREQVPPADKNVEESRDEAAIDTNSQTWEEHARNPHHDSKQHDDHATEALSQEIHPNQTRSDHAQEDFQDANNAERVDPLVHTDGDEVDPRGLPKPENEGHAADEVQPPVEKLKDHDVQETGEKKVYEPNDQEPNTPDGAALLHAVKVYYQDNEISLFPPREGDSSEMFFLEDESLAYQDFGKLFNSCREVLQQSIGENEILVMDIETLDIQLTEESPHTSRVTLSEVVDIYLHLCHNEDISEPEPLYLTLSTRLTIPAQLSELITAVDEGKGLSEIQPWDNYDEVAPASVEVHEGDYSQEPDLEAPGHRTSADEGLHEFQNASKDTETSLQTQDVYDELEEGQHRLQEVSKDTEASLQTQDVYDELEEGQHRLQEVSKDTEASVQTQDVYEELEEGQHKLQEVSKDTEAGLQTQDVYDELEEGEEPEGDKVPAGDNGEDFGSAEVVEAERREINERENDFQEPNKAEDGYDSEAPRTESTATVAQPNLEDEQHADESDNVTDNNQGSHGLDDERYEEATASHGEYEGQGTAAQSEYHETEAAVPHSEYEDTDDYYEEHQEAAEPDVNAPEQFEGDDASETYDENEPNVKNATENPSSNYKEENHPGDDWPDDTLEEFEDEDDGALHGDSESNLGMTSQVSGGKPRDDAEPADDLLNISEDLNNPVGTTQANEETEDQIEWEELGDETNDTSQAVPEDTEDWDFDNEDDIGLEAADTSEAGDDSHPHENPSTKRTREEEEFDLGETPNPDAKRRRSS